jgi:hypothetical protein
MPQAPLWAYVAFVQKFVPSRVQPWPIPEHNVIDEIRNPEGHLVPTNSREHERIQPRGTQRFGGLRPCSLAFAVLYRAYAMLNARAC